jgi:hypothetical protein
MLKISPATVHARRDNFTEVKFRFTQQRVLNRPSSSCGGRNSSRIKHRAGRISAGSATETLSE